MAFIVEVQNGLHAKHPEKEFETVSALDLVTLIYTQSYFDEIADMVHDFILGLAESFTSNTANSTVLKVVQYVKNNYNTDMKLEMLGNLFNCNSAYLGKKFREYTGVPFNTYMDIIRIEEAKKLLKSSKYKIYEISKMVGYSNTDYFYLKFKKHTNMTPKEYKASAGEEEK
jgi:two-component system response regulator YesN